MICEYQCQTQGSEEVFKRLFLFVHEYLSVQRSRPGFYDPYRKYGFAAGFLCEEQADILHLIDLTQIVSHFALTTLPDEGLIHVLPVDRVCSSSLYICICSFMSKHSLCIVFGLKILKDGPRSKEVTKFHDHDS